MTNLNSRIRWARLIVVLQVVLWAWAGPIGCSSDEKLESDSDSATAESSNNPEEEIEGDAGAKNGDFAAATDTDSGGAKAADSPEKAKSAGSTDQAKPADTAAAAGASETPEDSLSKELADDELGGNAKQEEKKPDPKDDLSIPLAQTEAPPPAAAPAPPLEAKQEKPISEVSITDLLYVAKKHGGTVVIETSAPATFHTREVPEQNQVVVEIANALLPAKLKQPYLTKDFQQSINSISAYQDSGSSTVRVVVQFKGPNHAVVNQDGTRIELSPAESLADVDESPTLGTNFAERADKAEATNRTAGASAALLDDSDPRILPPSSVDPAGYDNLKFYGKPISLEVRDTAVRDVINLIAEQSGANIMIGGDVDGTISLKIRQIPWDQALLLVLKTKSLGYIRQGSVLRIEKFETLRNEASEVLRVEEAQKAAEPLKVKIIPVGYGSVKDLAAQVGPFLSKRGRAVADPRTSALVVTDTAEVLERVGNLVKALDLPPLQVLIEGKVVEARDQFERDLGVNWSVGGMATQLGAQQITPQFGTTNLTLPTNGFAGGLAVGQFNLFGNITASLGLAESESLAHVVSSPRVVAVNNEQATIVQGTNIGVQTTQVANGVTTSSTAYTPIEMKLDVTPQVTSENDVIMLIKIKRDFAGTRTAGVAPDINHREASTRVLVRNGQTAVIGGVYQNDTNDAEIGVPGLRNIPVLGWLFKTKTSTHDKTELLVFLTPRILNAETSIQKENTL